MELISGVDSGYSWVIAVACCWVTFVIQGLVRSAGVVYVSLIDTFVVTRGQASWPFTLRMAIWNLSGPIAGALSYKWSIRVITFTGVLLVTVGNILCLFASDITTVTVFFGVLQGIGVGMAVTLIPVIINQYFSKYKTSGAGIACAGATAGSFALPPIVEYTIEEYGLKGSFLMMGGITLHGVLGAALMRPATWLKPVTERSTSRSKCEKSKTENGFVETSQTVIADNSKRMINTKKLTPIVESSVKIENELNGLDHQLKQNCQENQEDKKFNKTVRFSCEIFDKADTQPQVLLNENNEEIQFTNETSNLLEKSQTQVIPKKCSDFQNIDTNTSYDLENGKLRFMDEECNEQQNNITTYSQINCNHDENHQLICSYQKTNENNNLNQMRILTQSKEKSIKRKPNRFLTSVLAGFIEPAKMAWAVLRNPMFLIIASNYSIFFLSYMTYLIVIVDYSLDLGVDKADSVFLVSTFSVADLAGRLGSGWITDRGFVKRKNLMMCNMITLGVLMISTSFAKTYFIVMGVSVTAGLVVGINLIIFYALLDDYLSIQQLPMAIGLMNFSIGCISLVTPLLTGFFRDKLGSYDHLFHFLGVFLVLCGLLWILEPIQAKCKKRYTKQNGVAYHEDR